VKPIVRVATLTDETICAALEAEARHANAVAKGAAALFDEEPDGVLIERSEGTTLVAEIDGVVLGYATVRFSLIANQLVGRVSRVFVTREARRVGIGDALIAGVKAVASAAGCMRLDTLALPGDRDTKNLYERNGITARLIVASTDL
jgi:GNAT superfamily N-acetyltransferase